MKKLIVCSFLFFALGKIFAQPQIQLENFVTGLTLPLGVFHAGDERLFIVEKSGIIKVRMPNGNISTFLDINPLVSYNGQISSERGLLGLAFHPDYKSNGYFYVNYTRAAPTNDGATVVARYQVSAADSNVANVNSALGLLLINQPYANHNGGCMHFGKDGYLYIGMGDGGNSDDPLNKGQTDTTLLGKMLRIDVNNGSPYAIPADNPFVNNGNALPEIWAKGLRNPWRFSFDRITGDMWMGDVGQNAWEEINFQPFDSDGGENYGWRCFEGIVVFSPCLGATGLIDPIYVYDHSSAGGFSVTGGHVFRSAKYKGAWGYYLFADAVNQHLWASINNNGTFNTSKVLNGTAGAGNVSFGEDVHGNMYLVKHSGTIQKIKETGTAQPKAFMLNKFTNTICEGSSLLLEALSHPDLTYQWRKDGQDIPNAIGAIYNALEAGDYDLIVRDTVNIAAIPDTSTTISVTVIASSVSALFQENYTVDISDNSFGILTTIGGGTFSGTGVDANGVFTPSTAGEGTFEIVYTLEDNGCVQRDTATVIVTDLVSVENITLQPEIKVFPNPAKDNLTIQSNVFIKGITVYDMLGKIVLHNKVNSFTQNIGLNNMQQGMYFVKVESATTSTTQKVIIE